MRNWKPALLIAMPESVVMSSLELLRAESAAVNTAKAADKRDSRATRHWVLCPSRIDDSMLTSTMYHSLSK